MKGIPNANDITNQRQLITGLNINMVILYWKLKGINYNITNFRIGDLIITNPIIIDVILIILIWINYIKIWKYKE